jgi:hypothetical protein
VTRADLIAQLAARYGQYLLATSRAATDTADGLGPAIDDALRILGYADADLATATADDDATATDWRLQGAYRLMRQVLRDLGPTTFSIGTGGDSFSLSDIRKNAETDAKALADDVLLRFGTLGLVAVAGDETGGVITLDLNYLTPDCPALDRARFAWLGW